MKNTFLSLMMVVGLFTTSCTRTVVDVDLSGNYSGQLSTTFSNCDPSISDTSNIQVTFEIWENPEMGYNIDGAIFKCDGIRLFIPSSGILNYDKNCNGESYQVEIRITNGGELNFTETWTLNGCRGEQRGTLYK
jgi:hypothetical protein